MCAVYVNDESITTMQNVEEETVEKFVGKKAKKKMLRKWKKGAFMSDVTRTSKELGTLKLFSKVFHNKLDKILYKNIRSKLS